MSHCPEYQLCPSALNAVISSAHLVFCRADAMERHISDEKQSVPRRLGVKPVTPLLWRPAPVGHSSEKCPRRTKSSSSPPATKPGPRESFLKCKSDQDNHQLKTLQWSHTNHSKNPTPCLPWSSGVCPRFVPTSDIPSFRTYARLEFVPMLPFLPGAPTRCNQCNDSCPSRLCVTSSTEFSLTAYLCHHRILFFAIRLCLEYGFLFIHCCLPS